MGEWHRAIFGVTLPAFCELGVGLARAFQDAGSSRHRLVSAQDNINMERIELEAAAASAGLFGSDERRTDQLQQLPGRAHERCAGIEVHIVQNTEPPGGMGETGDVRDRPPDRHAVFAATGNRLRKLPVDSAQLKST
jgi:hypothetical protein